MESENYNKLNEDIKKSLENTQKSIDKVNEYLDEFNNEQPVKEIDRDNEQPVKEIDRDNAENIFIEKGKKKKKRKNTNVIGGFFGWLIGIIYYKVVPLGLLLGMLSFGIVPLGSGQHADNPILAIVCFVLLIVWANF